MNFVLDASVTMRWIFLDGTAGERAYASKELNLMKAPGRGALVSVTRALDVSSMIGKAEAGGWVSAAQSEAFLDTLKGIDVGEDAATFASALSDTLQIVRRYRHSSYGASYPELALRAGLPLATLDRDLQKAAHKAGVPRFAAG